MEGLALEDVDPFKGLECSLPTRGGCSWCPWSWKHRHMCTTPLPRHRWSTDYGAMSGRTR
ncbi:unnamed protein product [Spirodela intermedia]|uniref:Uncharacterized protein n=1 Tax=Spirodela intermedia TaxID=51605 RepID=A0A7I8L2R4_SPIIN|nr:unnamed protein product [Spirodela intermedia]